MIIDPASQLTYFDVLQLGSTGRLKMDVPCKVDAVLEYNGSKQIGCRPEPTTVILPGGTGFGKKEVRGIPVMFHPDNGQKPVMTLIGNSAYSRFIGKAGEKYVSVSEAGAALMKFEEEVKLVQAEYNLLGVDAPADVTVALALRDGKPRMLATLAAAKERVAKK